MLPEVLDEDLDADRDQRQAADNLHSPADRAADALAQQDGQKRQRARDQADHDAGEPDAAAEHRQRQADRERVDARRDRQQHQRRAPAGVAPQVLLDSADRRPDHPPADEGEQPERDPMVDRLDVGSNRNAQEPAGHRHQELEQTEVERQPERRAGALRPVGGARRQGHGDRVHRQADGQDEDGPERHQAPSDARCFCQ